jgi:hypothetical protein
VRYFLKDSVIFGNNRIASEITAARSLKAARHRLLEDSVASEVNHVKLPCVLVFVCTFALLPLLGCSAETNNGGSGGSAYLPRGGAWGGAVGSVSTIPAGSTAAASGGNGSVLITEAVQDPNQCGGNVYTAEAKSLDIYVMLDDSGSMFPWWPFTLDAVKQFVKAPESAGISMGFKFFGSDDVCDPQAYATPAVPIAPLPDNAANIEAALPFMPIESTPTQPALQGAITYAIPPSKTSHR